MRERAAVAWLREGARTCCENLLRGISTSWEGSLSRLSEDPPNVCCPTGETAAWLAASEVSATPPSPVDSDSFGSTVGWAFLSDGDATSPKVTLVRSCMTSQLRQRASLTAAVTTATERFTPSRYAGARQAATPGNQKT